MIEKTPMKVVQTDYHCDECADGYLRPTGVMLASNPPQYPHKCTCCDATKTFRERYPIISYTPEA